jgi:hypothetical protein
MRCMLLDIFNLGGQQAFPDPAIMKDAKAETGAVYFDAAATLTRLKQSFPEIILDEEDPLMAEAKRAESFFADKETPGTRTVVESLFEKASTFGPAVSFSLPVGQAQPITGLIRRYDIRFVYDEAIPALLLAAILKFLQSFGVGEIMDSLWRERGRAGSGANSVRATY